MAQAEAGGPGAAPAQPAGRPAVPAEPTGWYRCTAGGCPADIVRAESADRARQLYAGYNASFGRSVKEVDCVNAYPPPGGGQAICGLSRGKEGEAIIRTSDRTLLK